MNHLNVKSRSLLAGFTGGINLALILALPALQGCTGGGGKLIGGGSLASSAEISVTKFQGAERASWALDNSSKAYTNSLTVSFEGSCSRGVTGVRVKDGATQIGTDVTCGEAGTFTFSHVYGAPGTKALTFTAVLGDGSLASSGVASQDVEVDTTAPTIGAATTPASCGGANIVSAANVTLAGTFDNDVVSLTSTSSGTITVGTGTFSQDITMTNGETRTITLVATDRAGNTSTSCVQTLSFLSTMTIGASDVSSFSQAAAATSSTYTLSNSHGGSLGIVSSGSTTSTEVTSPIHYLMAGFTNIWKQVEP